MDKMVAFCGLDCAVCPAFLATRHDDDEERKKIAEQWSKEYNADLKPEDINCAGCLSTEDPLFGHCKVCEIRKCGLEKGIENCAHCGEYACEKLEKFFRFVPDAKTTLDGIRESI